MKANFHIANGLNGPDTLLMKDQAKNINQTFTAPVSPRLASQDLVKDYHKMIFEDQRRKVNPGVIPFNNEKPESRYSKASI
jgi:hypothetical protein